MKTSTLTGMLLLTGAAAFAQPVITSSIPIEAIGYTENVATAAATIAPGAGGAGVTWDYSGLSPVAAGVVKIISVASSPYAATFPGATNCSELTPTGGSPMYTYEKISSSYREAIATNYQGVGTGKDYTPNPEARLKFPFNYLESFTDNFQTTTSGVNSVTITYDGYGTLKTPYGTYTNVVRIKKDWGPGDYGYDYLATSPTLSIIMNYDATNNSYVIIGHTPTAVQQLSSDISSVSVYPNPFSDKVTVAVNTTSLNNASVSLTDMSGRIVKQVEISTPATTFSKGELAAGMYLYQVFNNGTRIATGKLAVQ